MGTFHRMMEFGRLLGLDEKGARFFAEGSDGPAAERLWAVEDARKERARVAAIAGASVAATVAESAQQPAPVGAAAGPGVRVVAESAQVALRMSPSEARTFAVGLQEREIRNGGREHADRWMALFAESLRTTAARL